MKGKYYLCRWNGFQ